MKKNSPTGCFMGLLTLDLQFEVSTMPPQNQKVNASTLEVSIGGPATNAALTFQRLGGKGTLLAALGQNPLSSFIQKELDRLDLAMKDLALGESRQPPLASVFQHPNGDRSIVSYRGEPLSFHRQLTNPQWFDKQSLLLLDGSHMEIAIELAKFAKQSGMTVILDAGSWKSGTQDLLPWIDIAIASADFCAPDWSGDGLDFLKASGVPYAAVSYGHLPLKYYSPSEKGQILIDSVNLVDTLGAGDVLHGAFCYYWAREADFRSALFRASKVASFSCQYRGAHTWFDYWENEHL